MALNYSLKITKLNLSGKVLMEKEGEVIFNRNHFRLKGKGANDQGEIINFTDIKELKIEGERFLFSTFAKQQFVLSSFGMSFDEFLKDFYRIKNEYFADTLFMKVGMLMAEFECHIEFANQFGKTAFKGKSRMQVYEGSIVFIPESGDALVIYYNFLKNHEFDEEEYILKLEADNGSKTHVYKLGSNFEDCKSAVESCLEKMYQRVLNQLNQVLEGFSLPTLLKFAYMIRDGRCVSINNLKKIDPNLAQGVIDLAFKDNKLLQEKVQFLRSLDKNEQFHIGFSFETISETREIKVKAWFLCALPGKNTIVLGISNHSENTKVLFFRIVMEQGMPAEKVAGKILEINQTMVLFDFDLSPLYKDKNDLKKSKYKIALMKLAFLRLLRRSFLGKNENKDLESFKISGQNFFNAASVLHKPLIRHRQMFKPILNKSLNSN